MAFTDLQEIWEEYPRGRFDIRYRGVVWEDMKLVVREETPEEKSQNKKKIHFKGYSPPAYSTISPVKTLYKRIFVNKIFNITLNLIFLYVHTGRTSAHSLGKVWGCLQEKR